VFHHLKQSSEEVSAHSIFHSFKDGERIRKKVGSWTEKSELKFPEKHQVIGTHTEYFISSSAVSQHYKQGDLNNRNLLSPRSGGSKSKIKGSGGLVPYEDTEGRICSKSLSWLVDGCLLFLFWQHWGLNSGAARQALYHLTTSIACVSSYILLYVCLCPNFSHKDFIETHPNYLIFT
jgi:hypothetical protein